MDTGKVDEVEPFMKTPTGAEGGTVEHFHFGIMA
jgi:hypothetical protein